MFKNTNTNHILFAISILAIASIVGNKFKKYVTDDDETKEYDMIKTYLLNESPLYGFNKPKIWIHSDYDINSRKWLDFQSRNNHNLNMPYIYLTIQSIISHCSKDFHICLIDDKSFNKLLPDWTIDISSLDGITKTHMREIAKLKLLQKFGGLIVPDSFVCLKSLKNFYENATEYKKPFICESLNRTAISSDKRSKFSPSIYFMGSPKHNPQLDLLVQHYLKLYENGHYTQADNFDKKTITFLDNLNKTDKITIIDGDKIGIKTNNGNPILIEDLLQDGFLDISNHCYGIYIPKYEILERNKYQWFSVLSKNELLDSDLAIVKYMKTSIIDYGTNIESKKVSFESSI